MQTKDDGTHVILPVADTLAVPSDHARLPVMMLRHADGKVRRDGSSAARPQPSPPVAERGGLHGAPELSAVGEQRTAAKERRTFSAIEERRRWRRRPDSSHRLGRQDKSADCGRAHVVGGIKVFGNLSHHHAGACLTKSNDFSGSSAVARIIAHGSRS